MADVVSSPTTHGLNNSIGTPYSGVYLFVVTVHDMEFGVLDKNTLVILVPRYTNKPKECSYRATYFSPIGT